MSDELPSGDAGEPRASRSREPRDRNEVVAAVDPALVTRISRWGDNLVRELPPVRTMVRTEMPFHLDPDAWRMGIVKVEERQIGGELANDLKSSVPQALLRDLHRPDIDLRKVRWEPQELGLDHAGLRTYAEAREAQKLPPIEPVPSSLTTLVETRRARAAWLSEPWQPHHPDDVPRAAPSVPLWTDD